MSKSLQTAKIEELLKTYKDYKKALNSVPWSEKYRNEVDAELFQIKTFIKDLKWLIDDETY